MSTDITGIIFSLDPVQIAAVTAVAVLLWVGLAAVAASVIHGGQIRHLFERKALLAGEARRALEVAEAQEDAVQEVEQEMLATTEKATAAA